MGSNGINKLSLESVRQTLVGLEDTIIFSLIKRANLPLNYPAYASNNLNLGFSASLFQFLVRATEAVQSQGGRYQSPEEVPFFPDNLPPSLVQPQDCSQDLPPKAASVSVNDNILNMYVNTLLPLLAPQGDDDGNYVLAVSSDLECLQAISRRIHYGKYVAEVKFQGDTEAYSTAIRAKDRDTLMNLLTDKKVEEMVKQRVEKKTMVFGQEVTLSDTNNSTKYKVDPSLVTRLYNEWIIPLTKVVEVEYLLRRLD